jgi:hypothetical protein
LKSSELQIQQDGLDMNALRLLMAEKFTIDYCYEEKKKCNGIMGVPITFLDKYSSEQFKIIGATESEGKGFSMGLWDKNSNVAQPLINNQRVYKRLFIIRKENNENDS